jgi:uncharacterized damage-inducible protein DinB
VKDEFVNYFCHLAGRVERAARSVPADKLWTKPFKFGNSVGHLVLHLTGNLNHYVGAQLGGTNYVRDRQKEFTDPTKYSIDELLDKFMRAVEVVIVTIQKMDEKALLTPVSGQAPIQTRFGLLLTVTAHMNNHIGQMAYLVQALGHSTQEQPSW